MFLTWFLVYWLYGSLCPLFVLFPFMSFFSLPMEVTGDSPARTRKETTHTAHRGLLSRHVLDSLLTLSYIPLPPSTSLLPPLPIPLHPQNSTHLINNPRSSSQAHQVSSSYLTHPTQNIAESQKLKPCWEDSLLEGLLGLGFYLLNPLDLYYHL